MEGLEPDPGAWSLVGGADLLLWRWLGGCRLSWSSAGKGWGEGKLLAFLLFPEIESTN